MRELRFLPIVTLAMIVSCEKKVGDDTTAGQAQDTTQAAGQMAMPGVQMIPVMRTHLDSMGAMSPADLAGAMTAHQDLASRTMDAMGADMRSMGMQPDSMWSALGDSLRRDLAELPALSGAGLRDRMNTHADRLRRMMTMHEGMMRM
jgi:hypothetical protein